MVEDIDPHIIDQMNIGLPPLYQMSVVTKEMEGTVIKLN